MDQAIDRERIRTTQRALRASYGLVPLVAGADKFTNLLCEWDKYLAPPVERLLPMKKRTFMKLVGVIEMAAGALVLSRATRFGSYLTGAWLAGLAGNLVLNRDYDIAVRDFQMALGAWTLAQLTEALTESHEPALPELSPQARAEAEEVDERLHLQPTSRPYVPETPHLTH